MKWTEHELKQALALYCQLPYGKLHSRNPDIVKLANKIGRTPGAVAMKLVNFASLDPSIVNSGRVGLGNASSLDRHIWEEFQLNWESEITGATEELMQLGVFADTKTGQAEEGPPESGEETTKKAHVEIRTKQHLFRRMVLSNYSTACCISGLTDPCLLVASHIVPWKTSKQDRLNPRNGLCLSVLHDRAYDRGLLTVLPDYTIAVSSHLKKSKDDFIQSTLVACHGKEIALPQKFHPNPELLEWHNNLIFEAVV